MIKSIINLFFPKVCYARHNLLNENMDTICLDCRHDLPVTNFHFDDNDNVAKVLYGRAKIKNGTALFRFEKIGNVQRLIHNLKYKEHEHIGFVLGNWLGGELKTLESYKDVDVVIPVSLHKKKHILLVDDLITTGATFVACILVLNQAKNIKISIATMAIA